MPTLDITFTVALPVHVAKLGAHWEAYQETLPALNSLRACNRFGKGPQCHITKLPVELVQRISHYYVVPTRQKKLKWWSSHLGCYEDGCKETSHWTKKEMLEAYEDRQKYDERPCVHHSPCQNAEDYVLNHMDSYEIHRYRQDEWAHRVGVDFPKTFPEFNKHFGLDIWLSNVCVGSMNDGSEYRKTTIAYLVLPNRSACSKNWDYLGGRYSYHDCSIHDCTFESGLGVAIAQFQDVTPEVTQHFNRVMITLSLNLFEHDSQPHGKILSLSPTIEEQASATNKISSVASFPRPMILVRNMVEGG